jgi:hypothetical protein
LFDEDEDEDEDEEEDEDADAVQQRLLMLKEGSVAVGGRRRFKDSCTNEEDEDEVLEVSAMLVCIFGDRLMFRMIWK